MNRRAPIRDLLLNIMHVAFDAETAVAKRLPQIKEYLLANDLKNFIDEELKRRRTHKVRLEAAFAVLQESPEGKSDDLVLQLNHLEIQLAETCGLSAFTDHFIIVLNLAITQHLINIYQAAVACSTTLEYMEVTRILRRVLLSEKQNGRKLKTIENSTNFSSKLVKVLP